MDAIRYSGQFTQDELAAAFRMGGQFKQWHINVIWIIAGCLAVAFLVMLVLDIDAVMVPIFSIFLLFTGTTLHLTPAMNAEKAFKQNPDFRNPVSGSVSEDGLSIESSRVQTQFKWNIYRSARLSPGLVLLYQTNNWYNIYPRKFFSTEADWLAFRSLVEQKIIKKSYYQKDPAPPLFGRYATLFIYGTLLLLVVFSVVYYYLSPAP